MATNQFVARNGIISLSDAQISGSLGVTGNITTQGTLTAQTLVIQTITASQEYSSGSNIFGNSLTNTQTFTGSVNITGSANINGPVTVSSQATQLQLLNSSNSLGATFTAGANGGLTIQATGTNQNIIINSIGAGYTQFGGNGIIVYGSVYAAGIATTNTDIGLVPWSGGNINFSPGSIVSGRFFASTGNLIVQRSGSSFTDGGYRLQIIGSGSASGSLYSNGLSTFDGSISGSQPSNNPLSSLILISGSINPTGSATGASAVLMNTALSASANNQALVGLDINPSYSTGSFTNISGYGIRLNSNNGAYPWYINAPSASNQLTIGSGNNISFPTIVFNSYSANFNLSGTLNVSTGVSSQFNRILSAGGNYDIQAYSTSVLARFTNSGNFIIGNNGTDAGTGILQVTGNVSVSSGDTTLSNNNSSSVYQLTVQGAQASAAQANIKLIDNGGRALVIGTSRNSYDATSTTIPFLGVQDGSTMLIRSSQTGTYANLILQAYSTTGNYGTIQIPNGNLGVGYGSTAPSVLSIAGIRTASAWGTTGINFSTAASTYTDSSTAASTTVTNNMVNTFGIPTLATTNTGITYSNAATLYIAGGPVGSGTTITNSYALYTNGPSIFTNSMYVNGFRQGSGFGQIILGNTGYSGAISFNNNSGSTQGLIGYDLGSTNALGIQSNGGSGYIHLDAGATEIMRVTVNGVNIGQTSANSSLGVGGNKAINSWGINGVQSQFLSATFNNNNTAASTTVAGMTAINSYAIPTLTATNSNVTFAQAATVYIAGAPTVSGSTTISNGNSYSIYTGAGKTLFGGLNYNNNSIYHGFATDTSSTNGFGMYVYMQSNDGFSSSGITSFTTNTSSISQVYAFNGVVRTATSSTVAKSVSYITDIANRGSGILTNAYGFYNQGIVNNGGGSITNNFGFYTEDLTSATNNYGFYGNVSSGTGKWNLYMAGTANNYLAGKLLIGTTTDAGYTGADINGTVRIQNTLTTSVDAIINGLSLGRGGGGSILNTIFGGADISGNNRSVAQALTTGIGNVAIGSGALSSITTTSLNVGIGLSAGTNYTGSSSIFIGRSSANLLVSGDNSIYIGTVTTQNFVSSASNLVIGSNATGRKLADGTTDWVNTGGSLLLLGNAIRGYSNADTNMIVIGHSGIGLGSNTTVLGNSSTTTTRIFGNLLLGSSTDNANGVLQVTGNSYFTGINTIQGTPSTDGLTYGSELATSGTIDASWTGTSFATGYTHTAGSTTAITTSIAATNGQYYVLQGTFSGITAGSVTISFGGQSYSGLQYNFNFPIAITATSTATLTISPTTDFNGTITLSLKAVTANASSLFTTKTSGGVTGLEFRTSLSSATAVTNLFIGQNAGQKAIQYNSSYSGYSYASNNTVIGQLAGQNITNATNNVLIGYQAGTNMTSTNGVTAIGYLAAQNLTVGSGTIIGYLAGTNATTATVLTLIGSQAGQNLTAGNNTLIGSTAGLNITTGNYNTIVGGNTRMGSTSSYNVVMGEGAAFGTTGNSNILLGFYTGRGNANIDSSILIGYNAQPNATGQSNQIVIGYNVTGLGSNTTLIGNGSTTLTRLYGNLLLGTNTDAGTGILQVTGNVNVISGTFLTSGNRTASAWGTTGINFSTAAATYTDSSTAASTTVTNNMVNTFGIPTLATTNTGITYTNAATLYIAGAPVAGTNSPTITNPYSLYVAAGSSSFGGNVTVNGNITTTGTLTAQTLVVQTVTASVEYSSGSNIFGNSLTNTQTMTGSVNITGSLNIAGKVSANNIVIADPTIYTITASGFSNTAISNTIALGSFAGNQATNANNSNFLGLNAGNSATSASNSNFIGQNAGQSATNAIASNFIGYNAGNSAIGSNNSNFIGQYAGNGATSAYNSNFLGTNAGNNATGAFNSNFLGQNAGNNAIGAYYSNFIGPFSGQSATNVYNSNFIGPYAGNGATNANNSNFIGYFAGYSATNANNSNFLGYSAGQSAPSASYSNFFGKYSGYGATYASYSIAIGFQSGYNFFGTYGIGSNNIIIGTNITLPDSASNAVNIGGLIFGTGSYSNVNSVPYAGSANGYIGINQPNPQYSLDVRGSTRISGSLGVGVPPSATAGRIDASNDIVAYSSSDKRFKTNIIPISNALDKISQISGYEFDWIPNSEFHGFKGHDVGVIAQEIEYVLPEIVTTRDSGYKAVKYEKIIPLLIEAIKEQQDQINQLKSKLEL